MERIWRAPKRYRLGLGAEVKGLNKQASLTSCAYALRKATDCIHLGGYERKETVAKENQENRGCGGREWGGREKRKRRESWENNSCEAKLYFLFGNINRARFLLIGPSRAFWLPYACVLRPDIKCSSTRIGTTMPLLIGIALL